MSAFIVSTETMHHVVDAIYQTLGNSEELGLFAGMPCIRCADLDKIGSALFDLNCAAVDQCYNEKSERPHYRAQLKFATSLQHYRAIDNLIYQCSEGDIPNQPLYQALRDLENAIACTIADGLCEARKIPWDLPDTQGVTLAEPAAVV